MTADRVFFQEWDSRQPGECRSLDRARALLASLDLEPPRSVARSVEPTPAGSATGSSDGVSTRTPPVLVVVGSKGKGTAASYASAYLCAAGERVVTVTSPSYRDTTERIRVDGTAVDTGTLAGLGQRLGAAIARLPGRAGAGYLSPSGLFTAAGLLLAREERASLVVLEAGRGGASDEVSLVDPTVVAVTAIFEEHLAELGGTLAAIVTDKCGVIGPGTRAVAVGPQPAGPVTDMIHASVSARTGGRLAAAELPAAYALPDRLLPQGLGRANGLLGCWAADHLCAVTGRTGPAPAALSAVLGSVRLPGRLSLHQLPGTEVLIDAAISRAGYAAAAVYARTRWGAIDHVLLSLPDGKDLAGAVAELPDLPVTFVPLQLGHLRYQRPLPPPWRRVEVDRVDRRFLAGCGRRVLALGTASFVAHLLQVVEAEAATAFRPA